MASPDVAGFSRLQSQDSQNSYVMWPEDPTSRPPDNSITEMALAAAGGGFVKYKGQCMLLTANTFLKDSEPERIVMSSHMGGEGHAQAFEWFGARFFRYGSEGLDYYIALQWLMGISFPAGAGAGSRQAAASSPSNRPLGSSIRAVLRKPELQFALFWMWPELLPPSAFSNAISLDNDDQIEPGPRSTTVRAVTPTSGTVEGSMVPATWIVRPPGARDFIEVFLMECPLPLRPGDRGSLVVDKATGRLFGHIVHYFAPAQVALVMPAKLVVEQVRRAMDQLASTSRPMTMTTQVKRVPELGIVRLLSRFPGLGPLGSISAVTIPKFPEASPNRELRLRYDAQLGDGPPGVVATRPDVIVMIVHQPGGRLPECGPGGGLLMVEFEEPGRGTMMVRLAERRQPGIVRWARRVDDWLRSRSGAERYRLGLCLHALGILLMLYACYVATGVEIDSE